MLALNVSTHLVLTIDPPADLSSLDQVNHLLFHLLDGPTKGGGHSLKFDRRERLEVQDQRTALNQVGEVLNMVAEMNIDYVSCLWVNGMSVSVRGEECVTHRISFKEF